MEGKENVRAIWVMQLLQCKALKIVELDVENNVLYVKGAVPGFNGSDSKN